MVEYKKLVRRANTEYRQIEEYVRRRACAIMDLDPVIYEFAFTRALQQPMMLEKIKSSDASFRRRMWKRVKSQTDILAKMGEEK